MHKIDLNLTNHAIGQLKLRYPNWTPEEIVNALEGNPTWKDGDEYHTYLGTGFDIYEGSNQVFRKRYQRRHLFIVSKLISGQWTQVTVVFHTNSALVKRLCKKETRVLKSDKRLDGKWIKVKSNVWKLLSSDQHDTIRGDLQWNYLDKIFITTTTLN